MDTGQNEIIKAKQFAGMTELIKMRTKKEKEALIVGGNFP